MEAQFLPQTKTQTPLPRVGAGAVCLCVDLSKDLHVHYSIYWVLLLYVRPVLCCVDAIVSRPICGSTDGLNFVHRTK